MGVRFFPRNWIVISSTQRHLAAINFTRHFMPQIVCLGCLLKKIIWQKICNISWFVIYICVNVSWILLDSIFFLNISGMVPKSTSQMEKTRKSWTCGSPLLPRPCHTHGTQPHGWPPWCRVHPTLSRWTFCPPRELYGCCRSGQWPKTLWRSWKSTPSHFWCSKTTGTPTTPRPQPHGWPPWSA